MRWLLDSGAVEHLVSASVADLLTDAPLVHLSRPVTLLYANGQQQKVDSARRVTLRIGVFSLHKLARDAGSLSWFMCADGKTSSAMALPVFLTLTDSDEVTTIERHLDDDADDNEKEKAQIKLDYVSDSA
ncbi:hypothetical protein FOZ63_028878, partial [Perkinsus olseni]